MATFRGTLAFLSNFYYPAPVQLVYPAVVRPDAVSKR